jgi:putative membrane protein
MKLSRPYSFDIVFIAIIHIAGIIGIRLFPELFLRTSFISIVIPLSLFLYRVKPNRKDSILMSLVYIIAFFSEWIGVCFGWLFGDYTYGDSLGFKLDGVPIIMGLNWLLLCLVSRELVGKLFYNKSLIIIASSFLMVLMDVLMEPLSDQLDFWSWKNNIIPFSNYFDWFLVALLNQTIFSFLNYKIDMFSWSLGYITIFILFFLSFYI